MAATTTGLLKGKTVALDELVPPLEGRRVRVVLEPLESQPEDLSDVILTQEEQAALGKHWVESGPQGPLDDE